MVELGLVVPGLVLISLPASAPRALGNVSLRRPAGLVPALLPPPVSLQAPTPASIAAAEPKAIHFRSVIGMSPLGVRKGKLGAAADHLRGNAGSGLS